VIIRYGDRGRLLPTQEQLPSTDRGESSVNSASLLAGKQSCYRRGHEADRKPGLVAGGRIGTKDSSTQAHDTWLSARQDRFTNP
jgi:hypothetical protein